MAAVYDLKLDRGWKFHLGDVKRYGRLDHQTYYMGSKAGGELGNLEIFCQENAWQEVAMPHDWLSFLPVDKEATPSGGYKKREMGWYQLTFALPETPVDSAQLVFDGVMGKCVVYVNGTIAVRNFSGYNRFCCEIGDYLLPGEENHIAVFVDARAWEGWWYEGAGLYRPVYIRFRESLCLEREECFVRGVLEDKQWYLLADFAVCGVDTCTDAVAAIAYQLYDPAGLQISEGEIDAQANTRIQIPVDQAILWSPESPNLYRLICKLIKDGVCVDEEAYDVGFRNIEWIPDKGMYLNGKHYTVKGICCHQDHAGVGVAVPEELMEYRIHRLKEFGINAYRCAHHAPGEELLRICDRLGMLVMSENRHFSVSSDTLQELRALVKVSRNHPSVFIYSLFNEEPWQGEERGLRISAKMRQCVRQLDDTRPVTAAVSAGVLSQANATDVQDVIGLNYQLDDYDACHKRMPDKVILATENCPTYGTRGNYADDKEKQIFASYSDKEAFFSESIVKTMHWVEEKEYVAGCFAWSGFDYRGEPAPFEWPSVISHWGITDNCGFAKDTAYYIKAWYSEEPMVHLLPHWNWADGETVRVCAFTNADTAELFVNGVSAGAKAVEDRRAEWLVPFEAGQIQVTAGWADGELTDTVQTAGAPVRMKLEDVTAGQKDSTVHVINLCVTDEQGILVPDFDKTVHFDLQGFTILGVGNGDSNGHHPDIADSVPFFHGKAQLILKGEKGTLTASCEGLEDSTYFIPNNFSFRSR